MECEAAAKMVSEWNGRKRGRKKRISVFRELNEAVECGTDGEWLQTQDNYFPAGGMEGAKAPSLTGCSLLMDSGMGTHTQKHASMHAHKCAYKCALSPSQCPSLLCRCKYI